MPEVRAALVTPLSGPLSYYGQATAAALRLWAERFAAPDSIRLDVVDAHPDPAAGVRRAERDAPHLLFGAYGSQPAARVAAATSRLVWNHSGARMQKRANVVNVLSPARTYFTGTIDIARNTVPRPKQVGILHASTGFSRSVANGAEQASVQRVLEVHRAVLPDDPPQADLLLLAGRFEDEIAVLRYLSRSHWRAIGAVAAGVQELLDEIGKSSCEGLLGPAQWIPETAPHPDLGPSASDFVDAYRARAGIDPPYPAAQAFAAGVIAMRCLHEAESSHDSALLAAAHELDCTTLFGRFRLDSVGRQIGHQVLTVQWQHGRRVVVWPPEHAQASLRY